MSSRAKKKKRERSERHEGLVASVCGRCGAEFYCMAKNPGKMHSCFCSKYPLHVGERDSCNGLCEGCLKVLCAD